MTQSYRLIVFLCCLIVWMASDLRAAEPQGKLPVQLTAENYAVWRDHILPSDEELQFQTLPWQVTFAAGLQAAAIQNKPLLLWVMNGHPLGCT